MRSVLLAALIIAVSSASPAHACTGLTKDRAFDEIAPTAENIIAIQIESLEFEQPASAGAHHFRGRIKVLKHFRGSDTFSEITYANSSCWGLRLDVGGMYIIATNQHGPTIPLSTSAPTILHLSGLFTFQPELVLKYSNVVQRLEAALRGDGSFPIGTDAERLGMSTFSPPPPVPRPQPEPIR